MKLRQWNEAKQKYDRGISIDPNDRKAYFNRGIVKSNLGDEIRAVADFRKAKEIFAETGDLSSLRRVEQILNQRQPILIPRQVR